MRTFGLSLLLVLCTSHAQDSVRFQTLEIYLNSPAHVAAWQFELDDTNGATKVVGVENGESPAFAETPYFDRDAVRLGTADRIVVADFSLSNEDELPIGVVRIATLHLMLTGNDDPEFDLDLITATTRDGQVIDATIHLEQPRGTPNE